MNEFQIIVILFNLLIIYAIWDMGIRKVVLNHFIFKLRFLHKQLRNFKEINREPDTQDLYNILDRMVTESIHAAPYLSISYIKATVKPLDPAQLQSVKNRFYASLDALKDTNAQARAKEVLDTLNITLLKIITFRSFVGLLASVSRMIFLLIKYSIFPEQKKAARYLHTEAVLQTTKKQDPMGVILEESMYPGNVGLV